MMTGLRWLRLPAVAATMALAGLGLSAGIGSGVSAASTVTVETGSAAPTIQELIADHPGQLSFVWWSPGSPVGACSPSEGEAVVTDLARLDQLTGPGTLSPTPAASGSCAFYPNISRTYNEVWYGAVAACTSTMEYLGVNACLQMQQSFLGFHWWGSDFACTGWYGGYGTASASVQTLDVLGPGTYQGDGHFSATPYGLSNVTDDVTTSNTVTVPS